MHAHNYGPPKVFLIQRRICSPWVFFSAGAKCIGSWQTSRSHGTSGGHQLCGNFCGLFGVEKEVVDGSWHGECYEVAAGK